MTPPLTTSCASLVVLVLAACGSGATPTTTPTPPPTATAPAGECEAAYVRWAALDDAGALAAADACVAAAPDDPTAHDARGEMLLVLGRLDDADAAFARAQALSPGFVPAHQGRAMVQFHKGELFEGIERLQGALPPGGVPTDGDRSPWIRVLEDLALAQWIATQEPEALATAAASVAAQGLPEPTATAVTHLARATLYAAGTSPRTPEALAELAAARQAEPAGFPAKVARARALQLRAAQDPATALAPELDLVRVELGEDHPQYLAAAIAVRIAEHKLADAEALATRLDAIDPYAAQQAWLQIGGRYLADQPAEARRCFDRIAARRLRSVVSATTLYTAVGLARRATPKP